MGVEDALHFGLIPRLHRGIFAMNELPELDELVQVGLFNILEERDVQIRGYPVQFDIDVLILFSANPSTYNRSGKVIPQLKDRIGSTIHTHYPLERDLGIQIVDQEVGKAEGGGGKAEHELDELETPPSPFPLPTSAVLVPYFMKELIEEVSRAARRSKYVDQQSGVSARLSIANYRTMIASARQRAAVLGEQPAVPRISDLGHLYASSLGKLELDMMGSHQMSERQVLDAVLADAIAMVFKEYVDKHGLAEIAEIFSKGAKIEVGDMLPSSHYAALIKRVPPVWDKAFEVNASDNEAVRASCVEFVLAGLYATDQISRSQHRGRIVYET
jgi:magnesium chelatase subunit I